MCATLPSGFECIVFDVVFSLLFLILEVAAYESQVRFFFLIRRLPFVFSGN